MDVRCNFCGVPFVGHKGKPMTLAGKKVKLRPDCDCFLEHAGETLVAIDTATGQAHPVELLDEHKPPMSAQERRAIEDENAAEAQRERLKTYARALAAAYAEAGKPVPDDVKALMS